VARGGSERDADRQLLRALGNRIGDSLRRYDHGKQERGRGERASRIMKNRRCALCPFNALLHGLDAGNGMIAIRAAIAARAAETAPWGSPEFERQRQIRPPIAEGISTSGASPVPPFLVSPMMPPS